MPSTATQSQTDRFSNDFNPAFGFVFDMVGNYVDTSTGVDGFDFGLRTGEMGISAWVDPNAWAYATIVYAEDEVAFEEGAIHYLGFGMDSTVRAGRFFVDYGKQMQAHVHELNTVVRPLVLREYLGEELTGDGLQWDQWFPYGEATALRYSVGIFSSLATDQLISGVETGETPPEVSDFEVRKFDELSFTGRFTGFTEFGSHSVFQYGTSGRFLPSFSMENEAGETVSDLSNLVAGIDLTYGWRDDTNTKTWTVCGEYLWNTGDLTANSLPGGVIGIENGTVGGYYAWVDHAWNRYNSAGLQWSRATSGVTGRPNTDEYDLYYTHNLSEFLRLRLALTHNSSDEFGDATRFAVQLTGIIGAHGHGINF